MAHKSLLLLILLNPQSAYISSHTEGVAAKESNTLKNFRIKAHESFLLINENIILSNKKFCWKLK